MSDRAALVGDFADIRTIKSRATVQVIIELPIEQGAEIVRLFGFPQPANPARIALALLNQKPPQIEAKAETPANSNEGREHGPFHTLTPTLQAVLRCKSEGFQRFLRERGQSGVDSEERAATYVRFACGVNTRGALTTNPAAARKWATIDAEFEEWSAVG